MNKNASKEYSILNLRNEGSLKEHDQIQEYEKQRVLLKRKKAIDVLENLPAVEEEVFELGKKD